MNTNKKRFFGLPVDIFFGANVASAGIAFIAKEISYGSSSGVTDFLVYVVFYVITFVLLFATATKINENQ